MKKILLLMIIGISCFSMQRGDLRKSPLSRNAALNAALVNKDIQRIKDYLNDPTYKETIKESINNALRFNKKNILSLFFKAGWKPENGHVFSSILIAGSMMVEGKETADTLLFMLGNNFEINERMLARAREFLARQTSLLNSMKATNNGDLKKQEEYVHELQEIVSILDQHLQFQETLSALKK